MRALMCCGLFIGALYLLLPVAAAPEGRSTPQGEPAKGGMTAEQLGSMLSNMGYEPKDLGSGDFEVIIERDNWKTYVGLSISPNGRYLWLDASLHTVSDPDRVPAATWRKLLEVNDQIGPAYFSWNKKTNKLWLFLPVENRDITPVRMRKEIEAFDAILRRTVDSWEKKHFQTAAPAAVEESEK